MNDNTIKFVVPEDSSEEMKTILTAVYGALSEKGYNPINQIVGYLLSEDPTYITNYNNARSLICKLDRDELLQELFVYCRPLPDLTLSNSSVICASGSAVQRETMTITRTLKMNAGSSS